MDLTVIIFQYTSNGKVKFSVLPILTHSQKQNPQHFTWIDL